MEIRPRGDILDFVDKASLGEVDGAYFGLSNLQYHSIRRYWSSSALKVLSESSPASFHYQYIKSWPESSDSAALRLGSAVHALVLEPEHFSRDFACMDFEPNRRSNAGKAQIEEFERANEGKLIISSEESNTAMAMANSVIGNKKIAPYLEDLHKEASVFWTCPYSGIKFRCRPDGFNDKHIIELKTTRVNGPKPFIKEIRERNYDLSLHHYAEGLRVELMLDHIEKYFIVVRNEWPFESWIRRADIAMQELGHAKWMDAVTKLETGLVHGLWPGWDDESDDVMEIGPALWELKEWGLSSGAPKEFDTDGDVW